MSEEIFYEPGARVKVHGIPKGTNGADANGKKGRVHVVNQDNGLVGIFLDVTQEGEDLVMSFLPKYLQPHFEAVSIRSETTMPPYFGGAQSEIIHIPMDTAYGRLPRASLPPLHSKDAKFSNSHVEEVFMKLFSGDFTAEWWLNGRELDFWGCNAQADKFHGRIINIRLAEKPAEETGADFKVTLKTFQQAFIRSLNESQIDAIHLRLLHRFLRAYGSCLPKSVTEMGWNYLYHGYIRNKWWKEQLDISMVYADIAFNNGYDNMEIGRILFYVGESLECLGRFKQAAEVYNQVASDYCPVRVDRVMSYHKSGSAYMSANALEEAERAYVLALHSDATSEGGWDLDSEQACDLFPDLCLLYWDLPLTMHGAGGATATESSIVMQLLVGLLYAKGGHGDNDFYTTIQSRGSRYRKALKKEFRGKTGAKQALLRAASYPDVASFRSAILSCMIPNYKMAVLQSPGYTSEGQERRVRNSLRKSVYKAAAQGQHTVCSNPNCRKVKSDDNADFKACPCRLVSYCQKSCQVAHWKEHKLVCSLKKNQKKNDAGA